MFPDLPQFVEPSRLADVAGRLEGKLDMGAMDRLREVILGTPGQVEVSIAFTRDERGIIRITGSYRAEVKLLCQRCLQSMTITLANPISIGLVTADMESNQISGEFDPVVMESREIALLTLIEDELLLGLPMSAMHALEICAANKARRKQAPEKPNPFAVLKNLKT